MNRITCFILMSFNVCFVSCESNAYKKPSHFPENDNALNSGNKRIDTAYMYTGYYFLTEGPGGVNMKKENSDEIYTISKVPFASVNNIVKAELEQNKLDGKTYNNLCMTFDAEGTKDLEEGTGNPRHPQIAIVIANKLLYVVDNNVNFTTGMMCVALVGYFKMEMEMMLQAVLDKK